VPVLGWQPGKSVTSFNDETFVRNTVPVLLLISFMGTRPGQSRIATVDLRVRRLEENRLTPAQERAADIGKA
jgi:hypothetical protein